MECDGIYTVVVPHEKITSPKMKADPRIITNGIITIMFDSNGIVEEVQMNNVRRLDKQSLFPRIHYKNAQSDEHITPSCATVTVLANGTNGVASVRWEGEIPAPLSAHSIAGKFCYYLTVIDEFLYLFVHGAIQYPETKRTDVMDMHQAQLIRRLDKGCYEVAPCELLFAQCADETHPFKVLKRNFLDVESSYLLDYYIHHSKNRNLANVNNHITSLYVAVAGKEGGVAVAMDTAVFANFAFCPLKMEHHCWRNEFSVRLNPFGTYFGSQYYQPTWSNRQGYLVGITVSQLCSHIQWCIAHVFNHDCIF